MFYKVLFRCLGLIMLTYFLSKADISKLQYYWLQIDWKYVFPLPLLSGLMMTLRAWRWSLLLCTQGVKLNRFHAWSVYASGVFLGIITPGRFGDLCRAVYVREKSGLDWSRAILGTVIDRLLDIIFIGLIASWAFFYFGFEVHIWQSSSMNWFLPIILGLLFALLLFRKKLAVFARGKWFSRILRYTVGWWKEGKDMLSMVGFSCGFYTASAYGVYFLLTIVLAHSVQMPLSVGQIVGAISLVGVASFLPISVAGVGTREAVLLLIMNQLGIENGIEKTLVFSAMFFVFCFVVPGLIGFLCFWTQPLSLNVLQKRFTDGRFHGEQI